VARSPLVVNSPMDHGSLTTDREADR